MIDLRCESLDATIFLVISCLIHLFIIAFPTRYSHELTTMVLVSITSYLHDVFHRHAYKISNSGGINWCRLQPQPSLSLRSRVTA